MTRRIPRRLAFVHPLPAGAIVALALLTTAPRSGAAPDDQPIPITEPARMQSSIAEHRALIAELRRNDPAGAQAAMERHVRNTAACAGIMI